MELSHLRKFYKKTLSEKLSALVAAGVISEKVKNQWTDGHYLLSEEIGTHMIENYIGNFELPLGLGMNFIINDEPVIIPMAIEEPSVIAAASNAAKIVAQSGGFQTRTLSNLKIGQIAFQNLPDTQTAKQLLEESKDELIALANEMQPSILKYGRGAVDLEIKIIPHDPQVQTPGFLVLYLYVDTAEAMGANTINTMLEGIAPKAEEIVKSPSLISILSNYATHAIFEAPCSIHPDHLATQTTSGKVIRNQIIAANQLALADTYRAVTHNKGIMNGIDSVVLATGNDWRAVEAGIHAYASRSGKYRALTDWSLGDNGHLVGRLEIPLTLGTVGGTMSTHPTTAFTQLILGHPNAEKLSQIVTAVGLAQNLAAVRALVSEGIQKGHMSLHAQSLAISVGAKNEEIAAVAEQLRQAKHMDTDMAQEILASLRLGS